MQLSIRSSIWELFNNLTSTLGVAVEAVAETAVVAPMEGQVLMG